MSACLDAMVTESNFYQLLIALSSCFISEPVFLFITLILLVLVPLGPKPEEVHLLINLCCLGR